VINQAPDFMMIVLVIVLVLTLAIYLFMQQPMFGRKPTAERQQVIQKAVNFKQGSFQNQSHTPSFTDGANFFTVLNKFFFAKKERNKPSVKTDLRQLGKNENVLVWMGHSSYFMQLDGKTFLVDPVLSGHASPFSFTTNSFAGSDIYTTDDIPAIDFLFISHDHWDHLDYKTITKLKPKIKHIVTGLGTAEHLEKWGFSKTIITEKNWNETALLAEGFTVTILPARHFSGRTFTRNKAVWVSFALTTPSHKIYLGGDSGYDTHFTETGALHGPFDLAILECGQYNPYWKHIHMMPEETVQAAIELKARQLLPVHWGKFALSMHAWDEPINRVTKAAAGAGLPLCTPMIGEKLEIKGQSRPVLRWWDGIH
jgi:L-ascorbate metabolism protein UlaG (beta-lactamase superfamily)